MLPGGRPISSEGKPTQCRLLFVLVDRDVEKLFWRRFTAPVAAVQSRSVSYRRAEMIVNFQLRKWQGDHPLGASS
jgi:hypothetical protein